MMTSHPVPSTSLPSTSTGGRLVPVPDGALPLVAASVRAEARGGLARVVLTQRFQNPHASPLAVTYTFPLPHDAAVSGYAFTVAGRRVVGEVDRRAAARVRFEEAILEGRTAALLEQERGSLFTQEIGNVPPGAEVTVELVLDQRLAFRSEGAWEWRFPLAAAPRYLGAEGRVADAAKVALDVVDGALPLRAMLELRIGDALPAFGCIESPSHTVATSAGGAGVEGAGVRLGDAAGAPLDRDVVVRWSAGAQHAGVTVSVARAREGSPLAGAAFACVTLVPPSPAGKPARLARDLVVLLDTSGSMGGEPLEQARRIVSALVSTLRDEDRLELVEFSSAARRWKNEAVNATAKHRAEALGWLASLRASGSTEMREGILEAMRPLGPESQRQIVLVTDGHIGFESEIVAAILEKLPPGACLHTVGVGSSVNRSLLAPAARAGRGTEQIVGLGEDAERAAARIVAATSTPLVVDVTVEGSALLAYAPAQIPGLFAGAPVLVAARVHPSGGELVVRGRTASGVWEERITVPASAPGDGAPGILALFGREAVEERELLAAYGSAGGGAKAVEADIERLGLDHQIATRLTSWVAVEEEASVDPTKPVRRVRVPQQLPHGMSAEGLGLRAAGGPPQVLRAMMLGGMPSPVAAMPPPPSSGRARVMSPSASKMLDLGRAPPAKAKGEAVRGAPPPLPAAAAPPPPPRAQAPEAPPRPSAVERAASAIGRIFGAGRKAEGDASSVGEPALEELATPRRLRGRIALRKGKTLVIEIAAEDAVVSWAVPREVTVTWAGGATSVVRTDPRSTAGLVTPGQVVRLVLALGDEDEARAESPVTVVLGDDTGLAGTLVVEL